MAYVDIISEVPNIRKPDNWNLCFSEGYISL